ncbi:hypothetical protein ACQI4F_03755 [Mycolicibacterium vaccae]|uniref:hypothetical protein n=1 Tax=Mycolicibacterium vaccae TaxID=1810 RepID=UPI003CF41E16
MSDHPRGASEASLATISELETRTWRTRLLVSVAVGMLIGALLGGLGFSALSSATTATSYLRLNEQTDLIALAGGADQSTPVTKDIQENYVAGEVAYLSGEGFATAVGNKMGYAEPATFEVTQNGGSTVLTVASTASSASEAVRTVETVIDLYRQHLSQRSDQQLRTVLPVLAEWEAGAPPDRVQQIQALRDRVQLQSSPARMLVVMQPPIPNDPKSDLWQVGALLGGILLGTVFPLILMGRRRRAGRLSSDPEIMTAVDGALLPAVDLRQPTRHSWGQKQTSLARTLWAQLPSTISPRTVVVIGGSSSSGTRLITDLLALAAAESGPVRTVALAESESPLPAGRDGTTLVDACALGSAAQLPATIAAATDLVVVARLGVDTVAQVLAVRSATAAVENVPLAAVFTHRPWWSRDRKPLRRNAPDRPVKPADV